MKHLHKLPNLSAILWLRMAVNSTQGMMCDLLWKYGNCKNLYETLGCWPVLSYLFFYSYRPRRAQSDLTALSLPKLEEDPCMMTSLAEKMFPQLSLEHKQSAGANTSLSCVSVHDGDKSVQLPSLNVEQNYSQMLSEIVAHF